MDLKTEDLGALVLKRMPAKTIGEFSLTGQMLSVLMEVDGKQSVGTVANKLGMDIRTIRSIIADLFDLKLIKADEKPPSFLDREFMEFMGSQLSLAIGPIAQVLIEDAVANLGYTDDRFPTHRAAELVDLLARQIRQEGKITSFKKNMVNMIRSKGY
jgi:hypothetical protein